MGWDWKGIMLAGCLWGKWDGKGRGLCEYGVLIGDC